MNRFDFEDALKELVLEAFIAGVSLDGSWTVELPSSNVPRWTIEIRKHAPDDESYPPSFLD